MACDVWRGQLDAYLDGEVPSDKAAALDAHLRECRDCALDALGRVQMKRAVSVAGKRYSPSADLRTRIAARVNTKAVSAKPAPTLAWWKIALVPALCLVVLSIALDFSVSRQNARRQNSYSELADLHVAALASAAPVDVVSTDRHTVKPWFQGKIPFTFNLPELQGTDFTLVGGRVAYFQQTSGAQLIYQLRKHEISVFIFPERGLAAPPLPGAGPVNEFSFTVESWSQNGLRYFVIGDAGPDAIHALSELLRNAG